MTSLYEAPNHPPPLAEGRVGASRTVRLDFDEVCQQAKGRLCDMGLVQGEGQGAGHISIEFDRHREAVDGIEGIVRPPLHRRPACPERADRRKRTDPHAAAGRLTRTPGTFL